MSWRTALSGALTAASLLACTVYTAATDSADGGVSWAGGSSGTSSGGPGGSSSGQGSSSGSTSSGGTSSGGTSSGGTSSGGSTSSSSGGPALTGFEQQILDGINAKRAAASPTPSPALAPLVWDYAAATHANGYVSACDTDGDSTVSVWGNGSGAGTASTVLGVLLGAESQYDYASNTCSSANCAVYKMVVARAAEKVACELSNDCSGFVWACQFTPLGDLDAQPY